MCLLLRPWLSPLSPYTSMKGYNITNFINRNIHFLHKSNILAKKGGGGIIPYKVIS